MAKLSYKIPVSIDRSRLDHKITLSAWQMKTKPLPLKVLLFWVLFGFVLAYTVLQSPFSSAPWYLLVLLGIWMFAVALVIGRQTKTGEMKFAQLRPLVEYAPKRNRQIMTRLSSEPFGFMSIVGIKDVDPSGIIRYVNGDIGQFYSIVGSASALLFDSDRNAIMRKVDHFNRTIDTDSTWLYLTTKESQRVFQQVAAVEKQNRALMYRDDELSMLMQEKVDILVDDVGGNYSSLHQYLLVRSPRIAALSAAHKALRAEREGSSLVFRRCELLNGPDALEVLKTVYRAPQPEKKGRIAA